MRSCRKIQEALGDGEKRILDSESKSDIKGINFRPGKIIGAGYRLVQYQIPLYKKFKPKKKCTNGENYVKIGLFLDIHRWRSKSEINEELDIIHKTVNQLSS